MCKNHGGKKPAAMANGQRRYLAAQVQAQAQAVLAHEGVAGVTDPVELLSRVAVEIAAMKDALAARVNALSSLSVTGDGLRARVEVELYERSLDRTMRAAEVLAKLDLEGRRQAAAERWGSEIAALLQAVLVELGLSEQQWLRVPVVVSRHLQGVVVSGQVEESGDADE